MFSIILTCPPSSTPSSGVLGVSYHHSILFRVVSIMCTWFGWNLNHPFNHLLCVHSSYLSALLSALSAVSLSFLCLSAYLPISPAVPLSVYMFIRSCSCRPLRLSVHPSFCCPYICLAIILSIYRFLCHLIQSFIYHRQITLKHSRAVLVKRK